VVNIFGNQVRNQFATIVKAMAGQSVKVDTSLVNKLDSQTSQRTLADYAAGNNDGSAGGGRNR
jgi:hypothetical protein